MPLPEPTMTVQDYWALPEGERAELIHGKLWRLATPNRLHQEISSALATALSNHISSHGGSCRAYAAPFAVNLFADDSTIVEPDLLVVCDRGKLTDRGCEGAPDLVVEIVSPASRQMDYGTKLNLYREAGVREYWIVDPSMGRTMAYRFDVDPAPAFYPFATPVPCGVLEGLQVDFAAIVADA